MAIAPTATVPESRILIDDLGKYLSEYLAPQEIEQIDEAYLVGAAAHDGQNRKSGEPYIFHPIAVARILAEIRLDSRSLMAAILHDVLEDTDITRDELANKFGEDVVFKLGWEGLLLKRDCLFGRPPTSLGQFLSLKQFLKTAVLRKE